MRGWLSRHGDGRFMFSKSRPALRRIRGTNKQAWYIPYDDETGDPAGYLGMCPEITEAIWPGASDMNPLTTRPVTVSGKLLE